jgi:hypothetical protein
MPFLHPIIGLFYMMIWFLAAFSSEEVSSTYALISIVEGGNKVAQLDETPNWLSNNTFLFPCLYQLP